MGCQNETDIKDQTIVCAYEVKEENKEIQIINDRDGNDINKEIETKIKILNDGLKENLIFKKKFNKTGINTIVFVVEEKMINMSFIFNQCSSLKEVKFNLSETSLITNMCGMFQGCNELVKIDFSKFDTSNVIDMSFMFNDCKKLKEIKGIENFNTINVTDMKAMFQNCYELENLDLSRFNTSNTVHMEAMFNEC